jgi:polyphosphate kinase 2 (PPK2 family)
MRKGYATGEDHEKQNQNKQSITVLLKFWLHIDPDEQLWRFRERREDVLAG